MLATSCCRLQKLMAISSTERHGLSGYESAWAKRDCTHRKLDCAADALCEPQLPRPFQPAIPGVCSIVQHPQPQHERQVMAFSTTGNREPLADINVTPLVDVMLVLLIIFIVTAPMLARPIVVDLPQRTPQQLVQAAPPEPIALRLDADGQVFWNASPLPLQQLQARLSEEMQVASGQQQPELRITASPDAQYAVLAKVLAAAKNAQVSRISFVQ